MIPFSRPPIVGKELDYIKDAILSGKLSGGHEFTEKCNKWLQNYSGTRQALLTTSCTHALEMAALLMRIDRNDEVIMPSYTFPSTANAFLLRGAKIVFVDIRPDTMNIDENLIEDAITERTRAIVPVHYAGVACEMDTILDIAKRKNLFVVEDAAQALMALYRGQALGSLGDLGAYSFHETKNYTCGEGGAILVNERKFIGRSEIILEKGTDRSLFFRGEVDKYSWQDIGSSYLPSDLNASFLYAQLEKATEINDDRLRSWNCYYDNLRELEKKGHISIPKIPKECKHNGHIFYIKVINLAERTRLIEHLYKQHICALFHYVPLHTAPAGKKFGRFFNEDKFTTKESERLLRLPLYYQMDENDVNLVCEQIELYYKMSG